MQNSGSGTLGSDHPELDVFKPIRRAEMIPAQPLIALGRRHNINEPVAALLLQNLAD
jgi:hypothetical protein